MKGPLAPRIAGAALGALAALVAAPAAPGRLSWLVAARACRRPASSSPTRCEREAERRRRRLLVAALPDALDLLAVGTAAGRSPAAGFAEIARAGAARWRRSSRADRRRARVRPAPRRGPRRRCGPGSRAARSRPSAPRSSAPAASARRWPTSCAASPRALRRDQRRAVEERAARAAPKIQLVVALVLVPSVLLMIAAGLIANADVLLGGF